jgi:hypothetical protein
MLIDREAVHRHIAFVHEHAAAAIRGLPNSRPVVLQLCSMAPDDRRFFTSAYCVGDVEHMTADALIDAEAGKNVFIEPRLVRPGRPNERGKLGDTMAVFACVADSDSDAGKPFAARLPASMLVETSADNEQRWFWVKPAIGGDDGQELGERMREHGGGDACSGNPVQPFRVAGLPNYPNQKKIRRGRVVSPTRLVWAAERAFTLEQLWAAFEPLAPPEPEPRRAPLPQSTGEICRPAFCRSRARSILKAEPGADRSAQFMSAVNFAVMGGMPPEQFEAIAREHLDGCAGKYAGRLRVEILRCYDKARDR